MTGNAEKPRVLVVAADGEREPLCAVLGRPLPPTWEVVEADSVERAHFSQQLDPCDLLLLDAGLVPADPAGLRRLSAPWRTPILLLSDEEPALLQAHFQAGLTHWLPRRLALDNPDLLVAVLVQAAELGDLRRRLRQREEKLVQCRRQVNRLVGLLWQTVPLDAHAPWFTQRHMLDRLREEVERSQRHGDPLTVVLGEVGADERRPAAADEGEVAAWTALQISRNKRRSDVAGQYGPHGFMLLLPHTSDKGAAVCCRRLRPLLEAPEPPRPLPPLVSWFGIASFTAGTEVNSLLGRAEERLEQARQNPQERLAV